MSALLFDPATLPPRDECGYTEHPDLDERFEHPERGEEYLNIEMFGTLGLELRIQQFEYDNVPKEVYDRYFEDGSGVPDWQPTPPEGEGWRVAAIYDTEDGPAAIFVRDIVRGHA